MELSVELSVPHFNPHISKYIFKDLSTYHKILNMYNWIIIVGGIFAFFAAMGIGAY
jgi:hypothetical protein